MAKFSKSPLSEYLAKTYRPDFGWQSQEAHAVPFDVK
jgi:hypothetical protein